MPYSKYLCVYIDVSFQEKQCLKAPEKSECLDGLIKFEVVGCGVKKDSIKTSM